MVTSDFICPLRTLHVHGGDTADLRGSVRVWDLAHRAITRTIVVGDPASPAGTMEVQLIPRDRRLRAFTAGMVDNKLYLVDTQEGTATAVFDFDVFSTPERAGDAAAPAYQPGGHAPVRHAQRRRQGRDVQHRASGPPEADERRGPWRRTQDRISCVSRATSDVSW